MHTAQTLICTVGTSLFVPNLAGLNESDDQPARRRLARQFVARAWDSVADSLAALPPADRVCGAEINSLASLFAQKYAAAEANLFFCHSATDDGRAIGAILTRYYRRVGHPIVEAREIEGLQDADPKQFRTLGLRNLAKVVCRTIRDYGSAQCAINATGGYKAQIAIAVLMGQALGVPVYYKHERFDEIIAFPPMPVALDFEVWMRLSGVLFALERPTPTPACLLDDVPVLREVIESLVERVTIDGADFVELSATGQIFHETFRERFRVARESVLPGPVSVTRKREPHVHNSGHVFRGVRAFLQRVTAEVPQVIRCVTYELNPDRPETTRFRLGSHGIEGILSDGTATVRYRVESSAETEEQRIALVAALNEWLYGNE